MYDPIPFLVSPLYMALPFHSPYNLYIIDKVVVEVVKLILFIYNNFSIAKKVAKKITMVKLTQKPSSNKQEIDF